MSAIKKILTVWFSTVILNYFNCGCQFKIKEIMVVETTWHIFVINIYLGRFLILFCR